MGRIRKGLLMLEKLLGLATIGSTYASLSLLHRFLVRLVAVLALTIISALMTGVLLMGLFYGLYCALISYGLVPDAAIILVGILMFVLTASLVCATISQIKKIRGLHPSPLYANLPGYSLISSLLESFMEGFSNHQHDDHHH